MIERHEDNIRVRYTLNGILHLSNDPAIQWKDGSWAWYLYGQRHRYYGKFCSWKDELWIHGTRVK